MDTNAEKSHCVTTKLYLNRNVVMRFIRLVGDARTLGRPDVTADQILPALEALDCEVIEPGTEIKIRMENE